MPFTSSIVTFLSSSAFTAFTATVSDAVFLAHGRVASSEVPAAVFLWWCLSAQCVVCSGCGS
jgi:hypothetical protein